MNTPIRSDRIEGLLDGFAVCASAACMVHCLVLPLVLAALPAFAERIGAGEWFHAAALMVALPTSALALIGGWRRHRAFGPVVVGAVGLALMGAGLVFANLHAIETGVTVAGSLCLAAAHVANWRRRGFECGCEDCPV